VQQNQKPLSAAAIPAAIDLSPVLAGMSHALRTPLSGVQGMANLLAETDLTPQQQRYLSALRQSSDQLNGLVTELIDLAKLNAGQLVLNRQPLALNPLLQSVCEDLRPKALTRGLNIHWTEQGLDAASPPKIMADDLRLRQILLFLVQRALAALKSGSVMLSVEAIGRPSMRPNQTGLRFSVHPTLASLEVPYSPILSDEERLTLAKVQTLARLFGGQLGFKEGKSRLTDLWFEALFDTDRASPVSVAADSLSTTPAHRRGARVLVVEDNAIAALLARALLTQEGCRVDCVSSADEVLSKTLADTYDLIFMDMGLPQMDGPSLTAALRARGITTPILALTAHQDEDSRATCLNAGMNDFLSKPLERIALRRALWHWLQRDTGVKPHWTLGAAQANLIP
jgi:CheY-like chemotaxis protein